MLVKNFCHGRVFSDMLIYNVWWFWGDQWSTLISCSSLVSLNFDYVNYTLLKFLSKNLLPLRMQVYKTASCKIMREAYKSCMQACS